MKTSEEEYKVDSNGCWIWPVGNEFRYGPHKKFYLLYKGPIPKGKVVRHTCDVKNCVNPDHLILGSPTDNYIDSSGKGQTRKLLAGQIKEKHFRLAYRLYRDRDSVMKKLLSL